MRRKRKNTNHPVKPDRKFNSLTVSLLTNKLMKHGKKAKAINIIDKSASLVTTELKLDFLPVLEQALNQIKPSLETKSKKFGGSNHRVPVKVEEKRSLTLALR
jgi:small subunit ribosomal protein S7